MTRAQAFPAERQSVPAARRFATEAISDSPPEVRHAVELMVSELATNCIRHVGSSFHLSIDRTPEQIRVEVTDQGGGTPTMRSPGPDEPTGRGLRIVDMLSERWGIEAQRPAGKTVWFTVAVPGDATTRRSRAAAPGRRSHGGPRVGGGFRARWRAGGGDDGLVSGRVPFQRPWWLMGRSWVAGRRVAAGPRGRGRESVAG